MGKQSRRKQVGPPGRTQTKKTVLDEIVNTSSVVKKSQEFENEEDFYAYFKSIGFQYLQFFAEFNYGEVVDKLKQALPATTVIDDTSVLDTGLIYRPNQLVELLASYTDSENLVIIHRTKQNAPAFLRGVLNLTVHQQGSADKALEFIKDNGDAPCALVVYRDSIFAVPSYVLQGDASFFARVVHSFATKQCLIDCVACAKPLMVFAEEACAMTEFVLGGCQHAMHPACAHAHFRLSPTPQSCPKCASPLPYEWSTFRASAGEILNRLSDNVKTAMSLDGLAK